MLPQVLKKFFRNRTKPQRSTPKPDAALPLGMAPDQLEQIKALLDTTPYKYYLVALERLYENNLGAMLRGLPHDGYLFQCGVCFALEQVARLPHDLIEKEKELHARHDSHERSAAADLNAERATFVNTPFWESYQRLSRSGNKYGGAGIPLPERRAGPGVSER